MTGASQSHLLSLISCRQPHTFGQSAILQVTGWRSERYLRDNSILCSTLHVFAYHATQSLREVGLARAVRLMRMQPRKCSGAQRSRTAKRPGKGGTDDAVGQPPDCMLLSQAPVALCYTASPIWQRQVPRRSSCSASGATMMLRYC